MTHEEEITLAQWKDLAVNESVRADREAAKRAETQGLLDVAVGHITASAKPAKPKPEPAPAAPAATPPPMPTLSQFNRMPSSEKARVRAAYGEDFEEKSYADLMQANRLATARVGGASRSVAGPYSRLSSQILEDRETKPAPFDPAQYAGRPIARTVPGQKAMTMAEAKTASRNAAIAQAQAHARAVTPAPAPPRTPAPRSTDGTFEKRAPKVLYLQK